jgi:hypothetical protein
MAKHQVFLVHGMGDFAAGWSVGSQQVLRDAWSKYQRIKELGLAGHFDFVEVTYNDIFEEIREQWRVNAAAAAGALSGTGLEDRAAQRLVALANAASGDDFARTHVLDVVMYRFMRQISERVTQSVRRQILDRLHSFAQNDTPSWSILGHSLGTAVVCDTLHAMFSQVVDGATLGERFKPDFVFMVANTSHLLWNKGGDSYASLVRPHSVDTLGMCWKYCDFSHELDPVPAVDAFDPPASWFPDGIKTSERSTFYADVKIRAADTQYLNVHGLNHYLSHPSVHVGIVNTLLGYEAATAAEAATVLANWRKKSLLQTELAKAKQQLLQSKISGQWTWQKVIDAIAQFRSLVLKQPKSEEGER